LGHSFRVAVIDTTLDADWLRRRAEKEMIAGCQHDRRLTPADVDACVEIVAQIGVEPYIEALRRHKPDIILAGRSCDNAIFAALPVMLGFPKGLALHLGKILECGGACLEPERGHMSVLGTLGEDGFTVEAADPDMRCTVRSVAAHAVYERTDPMFQAEPGGFLDMRESVLEPMGERGVRVRGSRWIDDEVYKVKLEGSEQIGYRSIFIGGARDPVYIERIDEILGRAREDIVAAMARRGLAVGKDFHVTFRVYGKNGVMGRRERAAGPPPHELGVILDIVATTQELAEDICYYGKNFLVWCNFEGRVTTAGNLAYPYSPTILNLGVVYRLRVHHLLPIEDPAFFPIRLVEVGA
ncbi:MAG: acyclic terpene utilization AtuA family protein, partial [Alphaproteobacteria bacterium]